MSGQMEGFVRDFNAGHALICLLCTLLVVLWGGWVRFGWGGNALLSLGGLFAK